MDSGRWCIDMSEWKADGLMNYVMDLDSTYETGVGLTDGVVRPVGDSASLDKTTRAGEL